MDTVEKIIVDILPIITAAVIPVVIEIGKKYIPQIPKLLLPLTSVALGTAVGYVLDFGAGAGAVAGAVAVAIRDTVDQVKKLVDAASAEPDA